MTIKKPKNAPTIPMFSHAMIFVAVRMPSPVRRPPLSLIFVRDEGTRTRAMMAMITGQNTQETQASTSATMAVVSVWAGAP